MTTQGGETDEEYSDDPIKLIDFEQKRVNTLKTLQNNCQTEDLTDSDVDVISDTVPLSKYKRVCFTLPASFFTISKNVDLLNECRHLAIRVEDCMKHRSYNTKNIRSTNTDSDIIIVDDEINEESVQNVCDSDTEDCIVISDSEKEESDISLGEQMGKPKIRPVDMILYYIRNNINNSVQRTSETLKPNEKCEKDSNIRNNINNSVQRTSETLKSNEKCEKDNNIRNNINNSVQKTSETLKPNEKCEKDSNIRNNINNSVKRTSETLKPNEKCEKDKGMLENEKGIDFKKNKGLVGLRIVQRANVNDHSKRSVGQKIVEGVNVDKTKDCKVEKEKSNKVDGKTSQSSKPVHYEVNTLQVSSKSKLLESNTTEKSVKQPESNLSTFNIKHSITNKESLRPNNTNSSKVYKETEKPSHVPEEINVTSKHDKHKSKDTSEKQKNYAEPNKTKSNKEKECISKYFKDVWDKDLRLALEPDTIQLKKRNNSLKYLKDKLKIYKRKSRKKNTKLVSNPVKLDTDNDGKANNNKRFEKLKKTTKDREKSKMKDSIVSDNTKKDSAHNKSMPSLLFGEQIATAKSQIDDNVSSKSTNKKTSKKLNKNKCMGVKEKSDVQPKNPIQKIQSNPKNCDVINEKTQTSRKDSNRLATQNKLDKKAERIKNNSETTNLGSSTVNYNLKRDVIDKVKPMSTLTVHNRINPGVMYKDKTSTSIPTAVNKQLQADKPLMSKPTTTQQTINQNNSHPLNHKQNEDSYNKDLRKSESLAKYLYYLQSLNQIPGGRNISLKNAVKTQECILSYVNDNQQVPKDPKTHTVSIGDVQKSSNPTGNTTSSATRLMNSQQMPNQPSNRGLVPPTQTMPNNSTDDCNKPDAVKKSNITFDDNNFNMTSSMQELPHNTSSAIGPTNSQQIPYQPSNEGFIPPAQSVPNNSTNDCNKPDAVKKSDKTFDDNNLNMHDLPHNTSSAIGPMNSQQIPNQPSNKGLIPPAQTMPSSTTNDCNKSDAVKKSDKTFDDNMNNSSMQDIAPNSNLVQEIDTATSIKSEVSIKHEDPSESSYLPLINPAQQTESQGRIIEEYGEPIQALVTNRKDYHKGKLGITPQVNMKNIGNLNTFPHSVIHCAPIYHGAPQNMPQGDQNQFRFYHSLLPPQGQQISQAQPPLSLPEPQMSQPFLQMSQSSPIILQHSQQMSQPSQQMPPPSLQMPQPSRQMPQPSQQVPQPSQQMSQPLRQMTQPSRQMPQPSQQKSQSSQQMSQPPQQMSQPSRQMPQPSRQMPQPSQQVPQPSQQMSQPSRQMPQPSKQMSESSQQMSQPSQQMSQPSQQMSQPSRQISQPSRQMPQPSRQMPQPSQLVAQPSQLVAQPSQLVAQPSQLVAQPSQLVAQPSQLVAQPSQQVAQPSQQMSQPSRKMRHPSRQMPQSSRQLPQPSRQMPQTSRQMPQTSQQMPQPSQQMLRPTSQMSLPTPQMWHSAPQISDPSSQFRYSTPQMSHNVQTPLWHPPPQMSPRSSQMYHPVLQKSHSQLRMSQPRQQMSQCDLKMSYLQTQNFDVCLCEKCQIGFPQMSNLPPQMLQPPPRMLNRNQEMPHFVQCLSNASPQISHPLPTSSHTQKQTWNPSQQLSNPQSQILHLPQQMSNPPVKYDNFAQSVSGSTIIGRNNDGVVRKINIVAAHAKGLPSSTEVRSNNEDLTPVESEKEMFEELCKLTTLDSPTKEESTSKKDLKRPLSKDDKIGESTPNRRRKIVPILKKIDDAMQVLKTISESALPVPNKGYSPPILPIATFEKTFEILAQANIELLDNGYFAPIKKNMNPILRKRRCLSFDERQDNAKKISIDEYKKRSTGKDDKAIDFVVKHRKDDQNGGQNPDQDLGYDSDTTMKL